MDIECMDIELVAIGDEVLYGYTINANASFIATLLLEHGFVPSRHLVVGDAPKPLKRQLVERLSRKACVITTGGLGPTCDDWTRKVLSDIFEKPPESGQLFPNSIGTACGFALHNEEKFPGALLIAVPGVPAEMQQMMRESVIPYLTARFQTSTRPWTKVLHFFKLKELDIDPSLRSIEKLYPSVQCGIYPAFGTVTVRLKCIAKDHQEAFNLLQPAESYLLERFGQWRFESPSGKLDEAVHLLLIKRKLTLATAESCTGGKLAATFVAHPGASAYFQGGIVAYNNRVKTELLGVDAGTLQKYGAVSEEVTVQMAKNIALQCKAACAVAVSGILGPDGAEADKPVGTICVSIVYGSNLTFSWTMHLTGNRQTILEKCIQQILIELFSLMR